LRLGKTTNPFAYNSRTGYIIGIELNPCMNSEEYIIYNNRGETIANLDNPDIFYRNYNSRFYWNEIDNEIIFEGEDGKLVKIYENLNREWVIKESDE
jgi:hypothetical protein